MRLCMLYKLHYGHVAAEGMPQLIPMRWASRKLNSNAYKVPHSRTNNHMNSIPLFLNSLDIFAESIFVLLSLLQL